MFNKNKTYRIKIQWKAQKIEWIDDLPKKILYERIKSKNQDLKSFLIEERKKKGVKVVLEYFIDDIDFAFWLNLNYFCREAIGESYVENLSYLYFSQPLLEKLYLKRLLGQSVTLEDCMDYDSTSSDIQKEEKERRAKATMEEENKDVMLYCSACCGDRDCGYFGIQVYQTENEVVWHIWIYGKTRAIKFDKTNYFEAFAELIDMINTNLEELEVEKIDIHGDANMLLTIDQKIDRLKQKYHIDKLDKKQLFEIFKTQNAEDIDTAICLGERSGYSSNQILADIDETYNNQFQKTKKDFGWEMIDHGEYLRSLDLNYPSITTKAFLLGLLLNRS